MARPSIRGTDEATKRLITYAEGNGWSVCRVKNQHLKFTKPGYRCVFHSGTTSDYRASLNTRSELRRATPLRGQA